MIDPSRYLDPHNSYRTEEAHALFDSLPKRLDLAPDSYTQSRLRVRYRGTWYLVCRTDLKDDVATGGPCGFTSVEEAAAAFRKHIVYGVRVHKATANNEYLFCCIDSFSDG